MTTQEQAEAGLSKRAARVLSKLRFPTSEDGCVKKTDLGVSTSGAAMRAVREELEAAGFLLDVGRRGWRLKGYDRDRVALRETLDEVTGTTKHHIMGERAAVGPMRVQVESKVVRDPAPEATSPLPDFAGDKAAVTQYDPEAEEAARTRFAEVAARNSEELASLGEQSDLPEASLSGAEINQSDETGAEDPSTPVETCDECAGPQDPCPRNDDEPTCPMLEQPFAIGDELWVKRVLWPSENALAPVVVRGLSGAGEPIVERLDGKPLQWRNSDRRVLDVPADLLKRELDRDEARALALIKEEPGVCTVLAEILHGFAVPF